MIVPMKKATVIIQAKEASSTASDLRKLGVLHIEHKQAPQAKDLSLLQEELNLIDRCFEVFNQTGIRTQSGQADLKFSSDWRPFARHVVSLWKRYDQLEAYSRSLLNSISEWQAWGDFDPHKVKQLKEKGIYLRLFQVPINHLDTFPKTAVVNKISVIAGLANCVVVSRQEFECPFTEVSLPKMSLGQMQERLQEDRKVMASIRNEILRCLSFRSELTKIKQALVKEIEFQQVLLGMGREGEIAYVSGYLPFDTVDALVNLARLKRWAFLLTDPCEEDNVPTLIRNPKWISFVSPIFKFLEILPGYRELDISLPFLIFFSIFFGILIGDAGYGLVYLLITFLIQRKTRGKVKGISSFFLFYILSLCAIIWGALTGIFFGQEWVLKAGYQPLLPVLNDEKYLQRFCFFLGALHLTIAHGWRGIVKAPSPRALGDLGSICVIWGAFFISRTLILGDTLPSFCAWLGLGGVILIILFTRPQKNILKSLNEWITWLVTLPFSLISNFADVVSYIRLFAVGMAGVAIADAFNAMAVMVGKGNMLMIAFAAVVALIGNFVGIVLGPVSVLVHGVRLNLLEFSGHMGLSWGGSPYKPLKE